MSSCKFLIPCLLHGHFAHQRRVVEEGSAGAPVQTSILPGSKCRVVLLRLVMQDAMGGVIGVYPEVDMIEDVEDSKFNV